MTLEERTIDNLVMDAIEEKCIINTEEKILYPPVAMSIGEKSIKTKDGMKTYPIPIGTYGNFSFVQAPPKTKKTFFVSLLASVYLVRISLVEKLRDIEKINSSCILTQSKESGIVKKYLEECLT